MGRKKKIEVESERSVQDILKDIQAVKDQKKDLDAELKKAGERQCVALLKSLIPKAGYFSDEEMEQLKDYLQGYRPKEKKEEQEEVISGKEKEPMEEEKQEEAVFRKEKESMEEEIRLDTYTQGKIEGL